MLCSSACPRCSACCSEPGSSSASRRARSRCVWRSCSWRVPSSWWSGERRAPMIGAGAIGLAAGIVAGLLGVGGGVVFVPGLVIFLGLNQHQAEATSLLAIVPVAIVGTYRQDRYGNVRRGDALLLGVLSIAGAVAGVALANV